MTRARRFLKLPVLCGLLLAGSVLSKEINVEKVHLVFSHHLDVGLDLLPNKITDDCVGFATNIVKAYFEQHIPRAISLAKELRASHPHYGFKYLVHAWVANLYVDCVPWKAKPGDGCEDNPANLICPTKEEIKAFDEAVVRGDIVYSDAPFNINAEAVAEPALFEALTRVSGVLDERYNLTELKSGSKTWSNIDVKGFSRSALPLLSKQNYGALYIGANGSPHPANATPTWGLQPVVGRRNASIFLWRDSAGEKSLPVIYHSGYGGYLTREECAISPNGVALASYIRPDNSGPPLNVSEVTDVYNAVEKAFPRAIVTGSSFQLFTKEALTPKVIAALPSSTTMDWGDQWLTGMSTDPYRLAGFRIMARAYSSCVISSKCDPTSRRMLNFTRFLAKNVEHTQGVQNEDWSPGIAGPNQAKVADYIHWTNEAFESVHNSKFNKFWQGDRSWLESRIFNQLAYDALKGHPLQKIINEEMQKLHVDSPPLIAGLHPIKVNQGPIQCGRAIAIALNASNGAISSLVYEQKEWASSLFDLTYVTYNRMEKWDTKKNLSDASQDRVWRPQLRRAWSDCLQSSSSCRIVTQSTFDTSMKRQYGSPSGVYFQYDISNGAIEATLTWFNKSTTRLPESLMLNFKPYEGASWTYAFDVLGEWTLAKDVGGGTTNPWQRGIRSGFSASRPGRTLNIDVLDAGMVCPIAEGIGLLGDSSPMGEGNPSLPLDSGAASLNVSGVAVSLVQNLMPISGYAQWYPFGVGENYQKQDENSIFRFKVWFA